MANPQNSATVTIDSQLQSRENNFDILRLGAALLVIASHSYPLLGLRPQEPILARGYDTGGALAVATFFVISGFLVTRSVLQRSCLSYLTSRVLRIIPALFVLTMLEVFLFGPLVTTLPLRDYFASQTTRDYLWNFDVFYIQPFLPGVFETHHQRGVNVSLWTIPLECFMYLLLPIFLVLGLLERRILLGATLLIAAFYIYAVTVLGLHWENQGWMVVKAVHTFALLKFGLFFLSGALMYLWRERIPLEKGLALIACVLLIIAARGSWNYLIYHLTVPYLVIFVALYKKISVPFYEKLGDISYGTYLYGSPVQQSIIALLGTHATPTRVTLASVPIVLTLATLSWLLVEKKFLRLKDSGRHSA